MLSLLTALSLATTPLPIDAACLAGRILNEAARPVRNAAVVLVESGGQVIATTFSGPTGEFSVGGVAPGRYWLIVERFGFEPEMSPLAFAADDALHREIALTPLYALAQRQEGRRQLPWLLRAAALDPTRLDVSSGPTVLDATGFDSTYSGGTSSVAGDTLSARVGWNALSADGNEGASVVGHSTRVELSGTVTPELRWFVDGRMDELEYRREASIDAVGADQFAYGVGVGRDNHDLQFRGEVTRVNGELGAGSVASGLAELRTSYRLAYRSGQSDDDLGVSVSYADAVTGAYDDGTDEPLSADSGEYHAVWEGRGHFARRVLGNLFRTELAVRGQSWTAPNAGLLASVLPGRGFLRDRGDLEASGLQFLIRKSYELSIGSRLSLTPQLDMGHGGSRGSSFRPKLAARLALNDRSEFRAETSWEVVDERLSARPGAVPALGVVLAFERAMEGGGRVRLKVLHNAGNEFDLEQLDERSVGHEDFVVLARGDASSNELRGDLRTGAIGPVDGYIGVTVGHVEGEIGLLPLTLDIPIISHPDLHDGFIRYASATLGALVVETTTDILIRYRWLHGAGGAEDFERLDIEVAQQLPWSTPGGARVDLQLALHSYLRKPSDVQDAFGFPLTLPSPLVTAGVGLKF